MSEIISYFLGESITETLKDTLNENYKIELYKLVYYDVGVTLLPRKILELLVSGN